MHRAWWTQVKTDVEKACACDWICWARPRCYINAPKDSFHDFLLTHLADFQITQDITGVTKSCRRWSRFEKKHFWGICVFINSTILGVTIVLYQRLLGFHPPFPSHHTTECSVFKRNIRMAHVLLFARSFEINHFQHVRPETRTRRALWRDKNTW